MNMQLPWNQRYAIRSYVNSALWIVPFAAVLIEQVFVRVASAVYGWLVASGTMDATSFVANISAAGARSIHETIITATLSFLVFTFGSLLVAIQVAGGQYTPRVIVTVFLRDKVVRACVGLFVIALLFALSALRELGDTVHQLSFILSSAFGLLSVVTFLFLIDYAARMLRPISIVARVGKLGLAVIKNVYPSPSTRPRPTQAAAKRPSPDRTVLNTGRSGVVLALNLEGLVELARQSGGSVEFVPQVGDFLATDEPLFNLYGAAAAIDDTVLLASVALGIERTMEQDPTFAFRILVDIAIKALSAAINDPTTAVLAIDQLHRLLRRVGLQDLRGEELRDTAGELRLIFRTPNWEDFVHLTCTEIRHCGAGSIQIVRRLRSMLENLTQTLPAHRHAELRQQLTLLDRTVQESYKFPEDLALARIPDPQGLGGALGMQAMDEGGNQ
ncbi:MAG: DUF2254 domain-containing protein [Rhodoferax sp.]